MTKKQTTKEKLLTAALDLIWRESFGAVSVDDICAKANVLKGSFYHFFPSKVDLAVETVKFSWLEYKKELDRLYAPDSPPLKRIRDHCDFSLKEQKRLTEEFGFVPGCPFTSLGSEQSTQNENLRTVIDTHLKYVMQYFTAAIQEAVNNGDIPKTNVTKKASEVFSLYLGTFTCARITNDLQPVKNLKHAMMSLLAAEAVAAR